MTNPNKTIARMNDELWQSYDLFRDPLLRCADLALIAETIKDVYQLYRVMSGMDPVEAENPQLLASMGDELAQAYDLIKDPLRRAGDPVLVLDVMKDLEDVSRRMKPARGLILDPPRVQNLSDILRRRQPVEELDLDPIQVYDPGAPPGPGDESSDDGEAPPRG